MGYQICAMKIHTELSHHHPHRQITFCTHALASRVFNPGIQGALNGFFVLKCGVKNGYLLCSGFTYYMIWMAEVH